MGGYKGSPETNLKRLAVGGDISRLAADFGAVGAFVPSAQEGGFAVGLVEMGWGLNELSGQWRGKTACRHYGRGYRRHIVYWPHCCMV